MTRVWAARAAVLAWALLIISLWASVAQQASAGHTMGSGDCWQGGTPYTCHGGYGGSGVLINIRAYDHFTDWYPGWLAPATTALNNWSAAPGPQVFSWTAGSYPKHYYDAEAGTHGLAGHAAGITWTCTMTSCISSNTAMVIYSANIYLNRALVGGYSTARKAWIFAHETGHSLGLWHHDSTSALMHPYSTANDWQGPRSIDLGPRPACSGSTSTWGIRCIYHWLN